MKKLILSFLVIACILLLPGKGNGQHSRLDSLFARGDTTSVMDSLMMGFDAYLDSISRTNSFVSVSAGMGNRSFSIKNNSLNTQETSRQLSFTPTIAYYHKSGLGLSATGFLTSLNSRVQFYQYAVTPSYDYINDHIATGISYTRYLGKDTATLNASPYDNDVYAYFNLHKKSWRYGIAAGYATGNFRDKITYADSIYRYRAEIQRFEWIHYNRTVESTNKIKDFSLSASVRKDFDWKSVFHKKDNLTLSITSYFVTGTSKISTSTNVNYATKKLKLARFKKSYNSADGNNFQVQSAALSASIFYSIGKFNLLPVWFMDYYFQDTDQKLSQVFSLTVAFNF